MLLMPKFISVTRRSFVDVFRLEEKSWKGKVNQEDINWVIDDRLIMQRKS